MPTKINRSRPGRRVSNLVESCRADCVPVDTLKPQHSPSTPRLCDARDHIMDFLATGLTEAESVKILCRVALAYTATTAMSAPMPAIKSLRRPACVRGTAMASRRSAREAPT